MAVGPGLVGDGVGLSVGLVVGTGDGVAESVGAGSGSSAGVALTDAAHTNGIAAAAAISGISRQWVRTFKLQADQDCVVSRFARFLRTLP